MKDYSPIVQFGSRSSNTKLKFPNIQCLPRAKISQQEIISNCLRFLLTVSPIEVIMKQAICITMPNRLCVIIFYLCHIKVNLKEASCDSVNSIDLTQDRDSLT